MGLTNSSVAHKATEALKIKKHPGKKIVALAGNPNVGKSTVFNALTGMKQHTGNWPGKTVASASGSFNTENSSNVLVDLPGTYSLLSHSEEEEIARDFLCFSPPDLTIVVCDATCLERNLNLVLQIMEICDNVIVCINMMDEAKRKKIHLDLTAIEKRLGVPVLGICAYKKKSLTALLSCIEKTLTEENYKTSKKIEYGEKIEEAISMLLPLITEKTGSDGISRWLSLRLLESNKDISQKIVSVFGESFFDDKLVVALENAKNFLEKNGIFENELKDIFVSAFIKKAEEICKNAVEYESKGYNSFDRKADKILTGKFTAYPIMVLFLMLIFWITITGANYPSEILSDLFSKAETVFNDFLLRIGVPHFLRLCLTEGVWRVLSWVISVMLPPMAIFFPLFTLLEDVGYLPRIAYNLDNPFRCCNACGKQALTMCMGFGCNAAGVVGCRIIDSKRERLLAILTNNFVPCNGRFPTLIALITMFFVGTAEGVVSSAISALLLTLIIVIGIFSTFIATWILSKTFLKGEPSSFALELPPYRKPQIVKVLIRSVFDRTLFVLGRAIAGAIPAGLIIWLMANVTIRDVTLLNHASSFLNPFAEIIGLDGVILFSFILGLPANEIVLPIALMAYMAEGSIGEIPNLMLLKKILIENGWTMLTAVNTMLFSLMHWPCSTTILTIKKETGSMKWTLFSVILPTLFGILLCALTTLIYNIIL